MASERLHKREITQEQYINATVNHNTTDIFTDSEVMGYGVYCEHYYEEDGKYYVNFYMGTSCD